MNLFFVLALCGAIRSGLGAVRPRNSDRPFDAQRYKLSIKLAESFSQDPEKNPFLKALEALPNKYATQEQVEAILGEDFSHVRAHGESARDYAIQLVRDEMIMYQDTAPFGNQQLARVFNDFYELMELRMNPDTLFLNKDSYVFFWEVPEGQFVGVYTMLSEKYQAYPPMDRLIEAAQRSFLRLVKHIVALKCPDFAHHDSAAFDHAKRVPASAPDVEAPIEEPHAQFDKDAVRNIFETLHTPIDPHYAFETKWADLPSLTAVALVAALLAAGG